MIREHDKVCPDCGGVFHPYGTTKRLVRGKRGESKIIFIKRYKCRSCNKVHNLIPYSITPYLRYDNEVISGVIEGFITSDTLGFENYPCELTMKRWKDHLQILTEIFTN